MSIISVPNIDNDPVKVQIAQSSSDKEQRKQAMRDKLLFFEESQAWELVEISEENSIVQCKWVFKRKIDSDNKATGLD